MTLQAAHRHPATQRNYYNNMPISDDLMKVHVITTLNVVTLYGNLRLMKVHVITILNVVTLYGNL